MKETSNYCLSYLQSLKVYRLLQHALCNFYGLKVSFMLSTETYSKQTAALRNPVESLLKNFLFRLLLNDAIRTYFMLLQKCQVKWFCSTKTVWCFSNSKDVETGTTWSQNILHIRNLLKKFVHGVISVPLTINSYHIYAVIQILVNQSQ